MKGKENEESIHREIRSIERHINWYEKSFDINEKFKKEWYSKWTPNEKRMFEKSENKAKYVKDLLLKTLAIHRVRLNEIKCKG